MFYNQKVYDRIPKYPHKAFIVASFNSLQPSEVLLYLLYLPDFASEISNYTAILSEDEKVRMMRFQTRTLQVNFALTRGLLRSILAQHTQQRPQELALGYFSQGKPFIQNSSLHFNLAHSGDYCLIGISKEDMIGVDIERSHFSGKAYYDIAKRFFTPREYTALLHTPISQSEALFYHMWTQKESFLKAIGAGLSFGLDQFEVATQLEQASISEIQDQQYADRTWSSLGFSQPEGYRISLTKENTLNTVHWCNFYNAPPS